MSGEEEEKAPPKIIANTVVSQGDDGKLQVFVNGERIVGTANVQIGGMVTLEVINERLLPGNSMGAGFDQVELGDGSRFGTG